MPGSLNQALGRSPVVLLGLLFASAGWGGGVLGPAGELFSPPVGWRVSGEVCLVPSGFVRRELRFRLPAESALAFRFRARGAGGGGVVDELRLDGRRFPGGCLEEDGAVFASWRFGEGTGRTNQYSFRGRHGVLLRGDGSGGAIWRVECVPSGEHFFRFEHCRAEAALEVEAIRLDENGRLAECLGRLCCPGSDGAEVAVEAVPGAVLRLGSPAKAWRELPGAKARNASLSAPVRVPRGKLVARLQEKSPRQQDWRELARQVVSADPGRQYLRLSFAAGGGELRLELSCAAGTAYVGQVTESAVALVPRPDSVDIGTFEDNLPLDRLPGGGRALAIWASDADARREWEKWSAWWQEELGVGRITYAESGQAERAQVQLYLAKDEAQAGALGKRFGLPVPLHPEGYALSVNRNRALVMSRTAEGLFRGLGTLRQLSLPQSGQIIAAEIRDQPEVDFRAGVLVLDDDAQKFEERLRQLIQAQVNGVLLEGAPLWATDQRSRDRLRRLFVHLRSLHLEPIPRLDEDGVWRAILAEKPQAGEGILVQKEGAILRGSERVRLGAGQVFFEGREVQAELVDGTALQAGHDCELLPGKVHFPYEQEGEGFWVRRLSRGRVPDGAEVRFSYTRAPAGLPLAPCLAHPAVKKMLADRAEGLVELGAGYVHLGLGPPARIGTDGLSLDSGKKNGGLYRDFLQGVIDEVCSRRPGTRLLFSGAGLNPYQCRHPAGDPLYAAAELLDASRLGAAGAVVEARQTDHAAAGPWAAAEYLAERGLRVYLAVNGGPELAARAVKELFTSRNQRPFRPLGLLFLRPGAEGLEAAACAWRPGN